ncbi:Uncharacterised protein [Staphylococcus gallinarum]|uniref:Uncharacterized protein n=1 Tax=Staphylococcus gallinarum TaxID=1293 RepID=A0A380SBW8_STAGA|nr:Uncharacterised protein [Staphylococcus gallinarum]
MVNVPDEDILKSSEDDIISHVENEIVRTDDSLGY